MDYYKSTIPIIDDGPAALAYATPAQVDGVEVGYGAVPRDYDLDPVAVRQEPTGLQLIPESEWDARYDEQERFKASLEHLFLPDPNGPPAFVNLDQGRDGDCWAYSTGHAVMFDRLRRGMPLVRLNPHGVAAMLGRPGNGGWCGLSAKFGREHGYPVEGTGPGQWPLHSHNLRYDTPECRASMALHKIAEDWYDLGRREWDQKLSRAQRATLAFMNIPVPADRMWWAHSTCDIRWVRVEAGSWGALTLNSWKGWGRHGLAVIRRENANADGAVAVRSTTASAA